MHNSEYKYACIIKNESFSSELTMLPLRAKDHLKKIPISDIRISLLSCWSGMSKRLPKHTVTYCLPWLFPSCERYVFTAEDAMHFRDRVQKLLS